jgi:hypothetical protein
VVTPETTRNLAVTLKVGERTDDKAETETEREIKLGILEMRGRFLGFDNLSSSGTIGPLDRRRRTMCHPGIQGPRHASQRLGSCALEW